MTHLLPRFAAPRAESAAEVDRWASYAALEDRRDVVWGQIAALLRERGQYTPREFDDRYDQLERESDELWRAMCRIDDQSFESDI